jgi:hypothetical protein
MPEAGAIRNRFAEVVRAAFAGGLMSEDTLAFRLGLLFGRRLIDPRALIGDLSLRTRRSRRSVAGTAARVWRRLLAQSTEVESIPLVLALDWVGAEPDLLLGRGADCDVRFSNDSISRHHARLTFRDGSWIIHDLGSTNGTFVNGHIVGRCDLQPGDRLELGEQLLQVD